MTTLVLSPPKCQYCLVIQIDQVEIEHGEMIPTYFLMMKLFALERYKDKRLYFVMGSDLLTSLPLWHEAEKLKAEIDFIIFARASWSNKLQPEQLPSKYTILKGAYQSDMSSTTIRNRVTTTVANQPENETLGVFGLVTESLRKYIADNRVYFEG